MASPKRMSDIFASSSEKDITMLSATPPYSSEGPTLPILGTTTATTGPEQYNDDHGSPIEEKSSGQQTTSQPHTVHPSLYTPWTLLPPEFLSHLPPSPSESVTVVVYTKNQNVKSGINKLKELLRSAQHDDKLIAISAQGEGTAKLVSIVDMAKRIVTPAKVKEKKDEGSGEKWCMYISLASVQGQRKGGKKETPGSAHVVDAQTDESEEGEVAMEVDVPAKEDIYSPKPVSVPVLTVWMAKKPIIAFREAFGEQIFTVQAIQDET